MLIGGDDSVVWSHTYSTNDLPVTRVPKGKLHESPNYKDRDAVNVRNDEGWVEGRDPADTKDKYFQIEIEVPDGQDGVDFLREFKLAAASAVAGGKVSCKLKILPRHYSQIRVDW
ncbi:MAG: hypothetical protein ND807_09815 [Vicinamibacterales bacterium]|nr:hypothetical protein [Vicinamibacterales bacterium]